MPYPANSTLTAGIDNIAGTSGNDTIIGGSGAAGAASTLGSADVINGGAGTDKLMLTTEGAAAVSATPNLTSVEQVFVQATTTVGGTTVNMVNATGTTEIWNQRSTDAVGLAVTNVQALATVGVKGEITGGSSYQVGFKDSLASGTADSVSIALDGATITNLGVGGMTAANEFETINIVATGSNTVTKLIQGTGAGVLAATQTVKVSGDGKLSLGATALAATVTTLDASANNGGVTATVAAGSGAQTITGGKGNDTFLMGATLTTADKVDGGAGTDIIGVSTGASLVSGLQVTGFETLDIRDADNQTGANAFDVSKLSGITTLKVGGALNGTVAGAQTTTVNNLAKGAAVEINAALGNAAGDTLEVNVKDSGAGSPNDVIDVLVKGSTAINTTGVLAVKDIETVNLTADKSTAVGSVTHTVADLTANQALTVNVKAGTAGLDIADLNATSLVLFDATAATAAVSVTTAGGTAFTATNGVAFKMGAAADTLVLTGSTTAGGDFFVTGGAGGDKITLTAAAAAAAENEVLVYSAATDSQSGKTAAGATKFDVITSFDDAAALVTDKIDVKAFNIAAGQQSVFVKTPGTAINDAGEVAAADQLNFFVNAGSKNGVAVVAAADVDGNTAGAQAGVYVFVDANGDGNFDAATDMTVALVGATAANIEAGTFVFA